MPRLTFPLVDLLVGTPVTGPRFGAAALLTHGVVLNLYADQACTQVLDATNLAGNAITSVTVNGVTIPPFLGPNNVTKVYARPQGATGNGFLLLSRDPDPALVTATQLGEAIGAYLSLAIAGANVQGGASTLSERLTTIEQALANVSGSAGRAGDTIIPFGTAADDTPATSGLLLGYFTPPVAYDVLTGLSMNLRGPVVAGDTIFDVDYSTNGGSSFTSLFGATKPKIPAGQKSWVFTQAPAVTVLPAGALTRARVLTAPTGGGSLLWRGAAQSGNLAAAAVSGITIAQTPALAAGYLQVACLFVASALTPQWPSEWTPIYSAGTSDATVGPFYLHVGIKVATSPEPAASISFGAATANAVLITFAAENGALVTPVAGNTVVVNPAANTGTTPAGIATTIANAIAVQLAMQRWTSGNAPGATTWDGSLTTDAQAQTARGTPVGTGSANAGIALTHKPVAAVTGSVPVNVATWAGGVARGLMSTLIVQPVAGAAPLGPELFLRLAATA